MFATIKTTQSTYHIDSDVVQIQFHDGSDNFYQLPLDRLHFAVKDYLSKNVSWKATVISSCINSDNSVPLKKPI